MPRLAPKRSVSVRQRSAAYAGWLGVAVLMATLLYWLYLTGIEQNRNWIVTTGLWAGLALLLYFVFGMGTAIIAGFRSPEGKRAIRSAVLVVAVLAILSVANVLAYRRHYQWDLTGNRRLTLAPVSVNLLHSLRKKITVTAFFTRDTRRGMEAQQANQVRDLLDQYADRSPNFHYQLIDYLREPDKFAAARMTSYPPVTLFEAEGGGREEVKGTTEKDFTAALIKLTRPNKKKIYFTMGHGELNPDTPETRDSATVVKSVLADQQYDIATVDLMGKERRVPADCSVLVIAGPQVELRSEEVKAVTDYLNGGGHALVLLRVTGPGLQPLLKDWGVTVGNDVVAQLVDLGGLTAISERVRVTKFETHDIDRGLSAVSFPLVRTLGSAKPTPTGVSITPLVKSGSDTIAKKVAPGQARVDPTPKPSDPKGPFNLAEVADKTGNGKESRVVVVGSTDWASDMLADDPTTSNRYLFTNAVNWLANEDVLVDIPPKDTPPEQVTLTPEQRIRSLYLNLLLFPVICLFMAGFVWWKRR